MYERFTSRACLVIELAAEIATQRGHNQIESVDVLLGMIREGQGVAGCVLKDHGLDHSQFDADIVPRQSDQERERPVDFHHKIDSEVSELVENARQESSWLNHNYVGTEHLLLGLCRVANSAAVKALMALDVQPGEVCKDAINLLGTGSEEWKRHHPEIDFTTGIELYIFD